MGKTELLCDCEEIHTEIVSQVRKYFPSQKIISTLTDFYKIFGDTTRLKILYALDKHEMCVHDISSLLNMTVSAVSHQLKVLREAKLVKSSREGKIIFYSLADNHVKEIIECGIEHITETEE